MQKKLLKRNLQRLMVVLTMVMFLDAADHMTGDNNTAGQSLSFPIGPCLYEKNNGYLFMGAGAKPAENNAQFSLVLGGHRDTTRVFNTLIPLVTQKAFINNNKEEALNPFFGAQIDHLALLVFNPSVPHVVAVHHDEPATAYIFQNNIAHNQKHTTLLSSGVLPDAGDQPTAGIVALETNSSMIRATSNAGALSLQPGMAVFAAVKNKDGVFGQTGSGIATVLVTQDAESKQHSLKQLKTVPLDVNSEVVKIENLLANMGEDVTLCNTVSMFNGKTASYVYAGLHVAAGEKSPSGAHGLIMWDAACEDEAIQTIALQKVAPDSAISDDSIVAAKGASKKVNIYKIASMKTTTHLRYLIVVGGVAPLGSQRTVFALPLADSGVLANAYAPPFDVCTSFYPQLFMFRSLPPAAQEGELYTSADIPARVGGETELSGDISSLIVEGDAVFVTIKNVPGVFHSQALFDDVGKIKAWTNWQPAGGIMEAVENIAFDQRTGNFWSLIVSSSGTIIKRTRWAKGEQGIAKVLNKLFTPQQGGIQGLFDFPKATLALNQYDKALAITIATGNKQVVFVQTGRMCDNTIIPCVQEENGFISTDGSLRNFKAGSSWLTMSGGALDDLGPIVAATIVHDENYGWVAVAGAGGVAVLAKPDGTGWPLDLGLQDGFNGLTEDMSWVKVGSWRAVRKLMFQNDIVSAQSSLYILTQKTLERLHIDPSIFRREAKIDPIILARSGVLAGGTHTFFSDALISKKIALLATSAGLLRSGNGVDVTRDFTSSVQWTSVILPESAGPAVRLFAISPTGIEQDVAQDMPYSSGNIYVLSAYVGSEQARVYRLTVDYRGEVDDRTITLLPDTMIGHKKTFFLNFGYYRNFITTDGAVFAVSRSKYFESPSFLEVLNPFWQHGSVANSGEKPVIKNAARVIVDKTARSIGRMIKSSVTGAWLVPGEFGLYVNE